ncbi:MAG: hypothetical protein ACM31C_13595 [Acidobacteriota bacterium]
MKRTQRSPWIAAGLAVLAGTALADVGAISRPRSVLDPAPADVGYISPECRQFLYVPVDATSVELRWSQRLSLAACRDQVAILPVSEYEGLQPLVTSLDNHAAPSIAIYRDAGSNGPTRIRILATYALGMTYLDTAVRARSAVRPGAQFGGPTYGNAAYYEELNKLHAALEPLLARDLRAASAAFEEVGFLAEDYPIPAMSSSLMRSVVRNARTQAQLLR